MSVAIVTGSLGLVGSEAARHFANRGMSVVGVDNDMRSYFFGQEASTRWNKSVLESNTRSHYRHKELDIRDTDAIDKLFSSYGKAVELVVHCAAQPSHDWAAQEPHTDFGVNAVGTLNLVDAVRRFSPDAVFIYMSTNKVYGDLPNKLPLKELDFRWEIAPGHQFEEGITEEMSVDRSLHSLYGASKLAADMVVQEYGRYFGMKTVCFRAGCISGPSHSGTRLHGFLAHLMRCATMGDKYTALGYKAKQVRDNLLASDLIAAFDQFFRRPGSAEVYNIGGGRTSNCSILEAIRTAQQIVGRRMNWSYSDAARRGDHVWWISGLSRFQRHYPDWKPVHDVRSILTEIHEQGRDRWAKGLRQETLFPISRTALSRSKTTSSPSTIPA